MHDPTHPWPWLDLREQVLADNDSSLPAMVPVSFGCHSDTEDSATVVAIPERSACRHVREDSCLEPRTGQHSKTSYEERAVDYLLLGAG